MTSPRTPSEILDAAGDLLAAREVLAETPHFGDCPKLMSDWDRAAFTANELAEMDCTCDQVVRAMLAFAALAREAGE